MFIRRNRCHSRTGKPPERSEWRGIRSSHRHSFYGAGVEKSKRTRVWYAPSRQEGYRMRDIILWKTALHHACVSQLLPLSPLWYEGIGVAVSRLEHVGELVIVRPR